MQYHDSSSMKRVNKQQKKEGTRRKARPCNEISRERKKRDIRAWGYDRVDSKTCAN